MCLILLLKKEITFIFILAIATTIVIGNNVLAVTYVPLNALNTVAGVDIAITPDGSKALFPSGLNIAIVDIASAQVTYAPLNAINWVPGVDIAITPSL